MKKILLLIIFYVGLGICAIGQDTETKRDGGRIAAMEIAYITKKLNLSPEEAQRFWPIFNKYKEDIRSVRIEQQQKKLSVIDVDERLLNIRKKYNNEFVKALSTEKVNGFFRAEKEFGSLLQKELIERRQQRMNNIKRNRQ